MERHSFEYTRLGNLAISGIMTGSVIGTGQGSRELHSRGSVGHLPMFDGRYLKHESSQSQGGVHEPQGGLSETSDVFIHLSFSDDLVSVGVGGFRLDTDHPA